MAYHEFTFDSVTRIFSLARDERHDLFAQVVEVEPSSVLKSVLEENVPLGVAIATEKARSELMIAPLLTEARKMMNRSVSLFSGIEFNVDPQQGLNGFCDFIISLSPEQFSLKAPVMMIVEAKGENIPSGFGQCIAEMIAARLFNQSEANGINTIYGAVTTGNIWRFLKLEGSTVFIDWPEYHISQTGKLLGIFLHILRRDEAWQAKAA
jgi:hypothetical protein